MRLLRGFFILVLCPYISFLLFVLQRVENTFTHHDEEEYQMLPTRVVERKEEQKFVNYNTTDVEEFKRLHRSYLIGRQEQLEGSDLYYLSTKARAKDKNGKPISTYAFGVGHLSYGFRNQIFVVTALVMHANKGGHEQLLLDSVNHLDLFGSDKYEPFEFYFDVEHWNRYSYIPENISPRNTYLEKKIPEQFPNRLPRLVFYDPSLHDQWNPTKNEYNNLETLLNATRPYGTNDTFMKLFGEYMRYSIGGGPLMPPSRNPAELLMMQGALRPHPALQAIIDRSKKLLANQTRKHHQDGSTGAAMGSSFRYMTVHARVEVDMQKHKRCRRKKVKGLQDIIYMIESKWSEPPVDAVFLPINRHLMEKEVELQEEFKKLGNATKEPLNLVAMRNLEVLNRLTNQDGMSMGGMWNGRVPVIEFGIEALRGTVYEKRPAISGAILDFYLALDADIFVGTEVSSFSYDIFNTRFQRGLLNSGTNESSDYMKFRKHNYRYLPGGIEEWVADDLMSPPGFEC